MAVLLLLLLLLILLLLLFSVSGNMAHRGHTQTHKPTTHTYIAVVMNRNTDTKT